MHARRLQVLAVLLAAGLAGMLFAPVFTPVGGLVRPVLLVLVPVGVADALSTRRPALRPALGLLGGLAVLTGLLLRDTTTAGLPTAATLQALRIGVTDSWARTLDTTWPARPEPALVLFVPLLVLLAAVLGIEVLRRFDRPAAALLPGLVVAGFSQAYSARGERSSVLLALAYAVPVVLLLAASTPAARGRFRWSAVPFAAGRAVLLAVAVGLGAAALTAVDPVGRPAFSLKERRQAELLPAAAVSPLSQLAERLRRPDTVVFQDRTDAPVDRWPLVVLDRFDGQEWTSSGRYQPFGGELPVDPAVRVPTARHTAVLKLVSLSGPWLPTQSRTAAVDGVEPFVDPATGALVADRAGAGSQYRLSWIAPELTAAQLSAATLDTAAGAGWSSPALPPGLADLARTATAGRSPSVTTALQLERWLRERYTLATGKSLPTGHGYPQVRHFLEDGRRGTSEQFAAAYVILARAAGIPARLAVGFRQPARPDGQGTYAVRNADALAWPEIAVTGVGWVPLDPSARAGDSAAAGDGLAAATAAARKALPRPDQIDPDDPGPAEVSAPEPPREPGHRPLLLLLVAVPALALLVVAAVPVLKALRRRRRRSATAETAVLGAWREVRDRLADHGLPPAAGLTPRDLAADAGALLGDRAAALHRIGACLDTALWSGRPVDASLAAAVWSEVDTVRGALAERPIRARLVAATTMRTLLPGQDRGASSRQAAPRIERVSL